MGRPEEKFWLWICLLSKNTATSSMIKHWENLTATEEMRGMAENRFWFVFQFLVCPQKHVWYSYSVSVIVEYTPIAFFLQHQNIF